MSAPDHREHVKRALEKLSAHLVVHKSQMDDVRRRTLPYIRNEFPDTEDWALMVKTERNPPFITVDILWHLPTGEHVDVNTAETLKINGRDTDQRRIKPAWKNQGINDRQKNGQWKPISVEAANLAPLGPAPIPNPGEPPTKPDPPSSGLEQRVAALEAKFERLKGAL